MPYSDIARNRAIERVGSLANWISLHTNDPGTTGAAEVSGGSYSRAQVTWNNNAAQGSASLGVLNATTAATVNVPAGTTVTYWGLWTTGGTGAGDFYYGGALAAAETFGSAGTYSITPTLSAIN